MDRAENRLCCRDDGCRDYAGSIRKSDFGKIISESAIHYDIKIEILSGINPAGIPVHYIRIRKTSAAGKQRLTAAEVFLIFADRTVNQS